MDAPVTITVKVNGLAATMAERLGLSVTPPTHRRDPFFEIIFDSQEDRDAFDALFAAYVDELQTNWRPHIWGM